ncbi:hypothetical protein AB833_09110 [Chromatiales bacterium (ex Bugula neritina AB1)]|nr:hypothetical protein AB833_09110 [Chromatiales bacterium (ex Bugula neritina AB1)]
MNIAILNLSAPYAALDHHGSAAYIIEQWLSPDFPEAVFTEVFVAIGEALPDAPDFDGYIISGSEKGVYDPCDWMEPLKNLLRELRQLQVPVFGICFGHQIMAEAYGGKAAKAEHGFVVGEKSYSEGSTTYRAHAMHQDQVTEIPDSATVTATASYCPVAALDYNFPARSVQFHPEFGNQLVADAIEDFEGDLLTPDEAAISRESISHNAVQHSLYAVEIADFFRRTGENY